MTDTAAEPLRLAVPGAPGDLGPGLGAAFGDSALGDSALGDCALGDSEVFPAGRADALVFVVGDAERAARRYRAALGLRCVAYAGPETGEPETVSYVLAAPGTRIVLTSLVQVIGPRGRELAGFLARHGDGVLDLSVGVPDVHYAYDYAVDRGALSLAEPYEARDAFGTVVLATIGVPGGTRHTLVDRAGYAGPYLPGYVPFGGW
ncbi:VOC family protein [Streptomyces sp. NRRL WC-3742]|uniref:VOC family protein n=1 Tax=Streptomyces sp. NRRL WC-3742 TaxID=1463934 RepID=UPI00068C6DDC|nr:VOC family protein [Streptomyces sp. NRRL WC-3742]